MLVANVIPWIHDPNNLKEQKKNCVRGNCIERRHENCLKHTPHRVCFCLIDLIIIGCIKIKPPLYRIFPFGRWGGDFTCRVVFFILAQAIFLFWHK